MKYIIFLDDGHGMETPGKRTPLFSDGSFMHENDFNRAVVTLILLMCQATSDVVPFLTAPTDEDVSLSGRTNYANTKYAEMKDKYGDNKVKAIYLSVHANALKGEWGTWGGHEIFYYPGSAEGQKLALAVYAEMVKGTGLSDRGVKARSLHMTKYPNMPSVLSESAFMDNFKEATLLRNWNFRLECATELFTGLCNYLEITPNIPDIFNSPTTSKNCLVVQGKLNNALLTITKMRDDANRALLKNK